MKILSPLILMYMPLFAVQTPPINRNITHFQNKKIQNLQNLLTQLSQQKINILQIIKILSIKSIKLKGDLEQLPLPPEIKSILLENLATGEEHLLKIEELYHLYAQDKLPEQVFITESLHLLEEQILVFIGQLGALNSGEENPFKENFIFILNLTLGVLDYLKINPLLLQDLFLYFYEFLGLILSISHKDISIEIPFLSPLSFLSLNRLIEKV